LSRLPEFGFIGIGLYKDAELPAIDPMPATRVYDKADRDTMLNVVTERGKLRKVGGMRVRVRTPSGCADARYYGAIAQLGEHLLCKQGVGGSSPPGSTGKCNCIRHFPPGVPSG